MFFNWQTNEIEKESPSKKGFQETEKKLLFQKKFSANPMQMNVQTLNLVLQTSVEKIRQTEDKKLLDKINQKN